MTTRYTRRQFMATSAASMAALSLPAVLRAQTAVPQHKLRAASRVLDIGGRAANVFGLENARGGQGLILDPGERFSVRLENALDIKTMIHWHGQIPPNDQDGVPDAPMPALRPGEARDYDFAPLAGTHWMHSHMPVQEMQLLAAPLIVRSDEDLAEDRQEVVLILQDFSFTSPDELMANIDHGPRHGAMDHGAMGGGMMSGMMGGDHGGMAGMNGMEMDLNDIDFDAYLANDRTLADPEIVRVERGGRVKLRIINAASATVFWIDTGGIEGRLVAVDGHAVEPLSGRRFGFAMGQRLDIELDLPAAEGAWPILALREGERERTGIILATPAGQVSKVVELGDEAAPAFDYDLAQEASLQAADAMPQRATAHSEMVMLGGTMSPYRWTINDRTWGEHVPIQVRSGGRVELMFHNMSMMAHPMHLHGHVFQVVGIGGPGIGMRRINGAMRDTVHIPPMSMVTIAFDTGEAARWMLHCHHMPHLITGMMTELVVSA
ncbi:multicopper oxidase family protein [Blastomonas fulva]|uniref:multicopper oxidase family protein n=1 Tax=Blastomonas fulva TaxID=1550728 RepID=UPI003D276DB7